MPDLDMSPYAAFVWPAWGVTALVLAALVARAVIAARRWNADLKRLEDGEPAQAASATVARDTP